MTSLIAPSASAEPAARCTPSSNSIRGWPMRSGSPTYGATAQAIVDAVFALAAAAEAPPAEPDGA